MIIAAEKLPNFYHLCDMKNPNTPPDNRINDMKNSLLRVFTFHEANTPVKIMIPVNAIIATEMPSTPTR